MKLPIRVAALLVLLCALSTPLAMAQVETEGPYQSPMKGECMAEMEKDATWRAEIRNDLRAVVHEEETSKLLRNKQHVVAAYAVIWGLMIAFVTFIFFRQRKLTGEITRLEAELSKAAED